MSSWREKNRARVDIPFLRDSLSSPSFSLVGAPAIDGKVNGTRLFLVRFSLWPQTFLGVFLGGEKEQTKRCTK